MKKLLLYLTILALPVISAGCKSKDTSDLKSIMTTEANGAMSPTTTAAEGANGAMSPTTIAPTSDSKESSSLAETKSDKTTTAEKKSSSKSSVTENSQSYSKDKSKISYPKLSGIDSKIESSVNKAIEDNAKLALDSFASSAGSTVELKYNVKNQSRNRMSIVYTGTLKSVNESKKIIFTNNINLDTGESIGLIDFADPLTIANYILSDDVELENATNSQAAGFTEYKKTLTVDTLKALLEDADFPLIKKNDVNEGFPKLFSYESGGDIFIAIPLSHELGDYVLVKYSPSTK
ncbi:hypothetical protein EHV10_09270 [Lachnoanaerobaculum gingivalis]|uniref:DUF4163 domain-containing protein n=1 Tax=Lachnoanaerobaculum gingivalis TaxID=2490855 RepID=A0A3P3QV36_9FIRM|nr:hypothetical protein [Lachnoanaerobaculum gingivalis]RRJ25092.1 hypothetical protein EHV10_09270 [Lachnoanaerobaculum gingivalis]